MDWLINGVDYDFKDWFSKTSSLTTPPKISMKEYDGKSKGFDITKEDLEKLLDLPRKEEVPMSVSVIKSADDSERIVVCKNEHDLSMEHIVKTLAIAKDTLLSVIAFKSVQKIECSVTPLIRKHIIDANKKLNMYGKRPPIIAHFDEWGQRLPDDVDLGFSEGITLKIVDPKEYGESYLELKATLYIKPIEDDFLPFYNCRKLDSIEKIRFD